MLLSNGRYSPLQVPQAFQETAPQFNESYFAPKTGIHLATSVATYGMMYRVQPHLFSAVDKIANLVAKLNVQVFDTSPATGDILDRKGPYAKLMKDPCLSLDPFKFYHWLTTTYEIYGEAYLLKNRVDGKTASFIPMHPAVTYVHRSESGLLLYGFTGIPDMWFTEKDVVPFRRYNPDNTMRGLSRMEPLRQTLMNEDSARRAMYAHWQNMMVPNYVLSTSKRLGDKGREHLEKGVQAAHGGADNAGGVMVLEDDVTATRMQLDAEEMQYIESRKLNRDECFEVYDLNPAAAQINDHTTQTSYGPMTKDVYKASVDHRLRNFESVFNHYVGSEFNGPKEARWNVSQQLRGDIEILAPAIVQLVQTGVMKPAEGRMWLDLPDEGDVANHLYANANLQKLGELGGMHQTRINEDTPLVTPGQHPTSNTNPPVATGDLPKKLPALGDKGKMYKEAIFAGLGRGKTWDEVAHVLMERNPTDRQDIQSACLHILVEQR